MPIDGVSALAVILIASFGIDRVVTGSLFLLSFVKPWNRAFPRPSEIADTAERSRAERKHKLVYFILAGLLGGVVLAFFGEVRIFHALGFTRTNYILDSIMTGLILIAGADRISEVLKLAPGSPGEKPPSSPPIEITGRLILEDEKRREAIDDESQILR